MSVGILPGAEALGNVPRITEGGPSGVGTGEMEAKRTATQAASLMALLQARADTALPMKLSKVWLGDGLGSLAKKTHERMLRWEFIELGELRPKNPLERVPAEADTQKLVILPGFEVSQVKRKPITDIITWAHCFARYTAAMSAEYPECTPGFMAHMLTVFKAYTEVEDPAWRMYDEVYREKMAATSCRRWSGMDVQLYQEVCAGRLRSKMPATPVEAMAGAGAKRPRDEKRPVVCWQFNLGGVCSYGKACKFPHVCEYCLGPHPKGRCFKAAEKKRRPAP